MIPSGPVIALLSESALVVTAALLAGRAKPIAILLGAVAFLVAPWFAGPVPLARGLAALVGGVGLLRVIDVVRTREQWGASRRVAHVLSFVDSRTLHRASPRLDLLALGRSLVWAALAAAAFVASGSPRFLTRWASGLVLAYAVIESGYALVAALYRVLGFVTPPLHVWPIASSSVGELWGTRWARPISTWLRETCFRPLARRGHPRLGLLLGFAASAFGHAYPVFVALDVTMAALMLSFFLVQGIAVLVETRFATSRWPRPLRRVWTVAWMVGSSLLFVEPALRVLGRR